MRRRPIFTSRKRLQESAPLGCKYPLFSTTPRTAAREERRFGSATVVHLCGTFSSTDHLNLLLVFQGSGTAGHPITLLFETGADLTNTYWGLHGASAITTAGASHIVIDGNNVRIIEDTQNGTGLANHAGSSAVYHVPKSENGPLRTAFQGQPWTISVASCQHRMRSNENCELKMRL
jgi:hypothetical protein